MKLKELLKKRFYESHLQQNQMMANDFRILDTLLPDIFPSQNITNQVINGLSHDDKNFKFNYNVRCLPFHLHDDEWMENYMKRAISQILSLQGNERKNNKEVLPFLSLDQHSFYYSPYWTPGPVKAKSITKYIKYSPKYVAKRDEFEQSVAVAYMTNLICDRNYDFYLSAENKDKCLKSPDCDIIFRSTVIDAMHSIGISKENTEKSLEINAHLWRKSMMCRAFYNEKSILSQDQLHLLKNGNYEIYKNLMDKENLLLRAFEHEYYQRNKNVIKKVGGAIPGMELTPAKVTELKEQIKVLTAQYQAANYKAVNVVASLQNMQRQNDSKQK